MLAGVEERSHLFTRSVFEFASLDPFELSVPSLFTQVILRFRHLEQVSEPYSISHLVLSRRQASQERMRRRRFLEGSLSFCVAPFETCGSCVEMS